MPTTTTNIITTTTTTTRQSPQLRTESSTIWTRKCSVTTHTPSTGVIVAAAVAAAVENY